MKVEKNDTHEQSGAMDVYVKRPTSVIVRTLLACVIIGLIWSGIIWVALHMSGFIKSDSVNVTIEEVGAETLNNIQPLIDATCYHQTSLDLQKRSDSLDPNSQYVVTDVDGFMLSLDEVWCATEVAIATYGVDGWVSKEKEVTWFVLSRNLKQISDGEQSNLIMRYVPEQAYQNALADYKELENK